jgi:hypothetical protein
MLDSIATVILTGMMLIPVLNVLVGLIAGGASFGLSGASAGGSLGILITLMQARPRRVVGGRSSTAEIVDFPAPQSLSCPPTA